MQEFSFWEKIRPWQRISFLSFGAGLAIFFLVTTGYFLWEKGHQGRIYPGVKIGGVDFGGKKPQEVDDYFRQKESEIVLDFTFIHKDLTAILSAQEVNWGYDEKLMSTQAYSFGRSGNFLSDLYQKLLAAKDGYNLPLLYSYEESRLATFLEKIAQEINIAPQEALFRFWGGRVTAFRPSANGQALNIEKATKEVAESFSLFKEGRLPSALTIELPVEKVEPEIKTEEANNLGVKELVGRGSSRFWGSIPNRVHNIQLAASRLNGILVSPGEEFSFNRSLGDVSKFTGYKEAYVIKDGRTILGDGGGVCQVSTTLFRAILNAGLSVSERHPHSYRVGYYEQGSPPGFDASVYDPHWDLKFKNDTAHYLLIQSFVDFKTAALTFEFYGTGDGRIVTLTKPVITNRVPPPEDLYQDDPALPKGQIKQIDWRAEGADVSFTRFVKKGDKILINETFSSHYQPWQTVYLVGTKEEN